MHSHTTITFCVLCVVLIIKIALNTILCIYKSVQYTAMHVTMVML